MLKRSSYIVLGIAAMSLPLSGCTSNDVAEVVTTLPAFEIPEKYSSFSSYIGGINSTYISGEDGRTFMMIAEEKDQTNYSKNSYLEHLTAGLGSQAKCLNTDRPIETDSAIIFKSESEEKICCYINAKSLQKNVTITLQHPEESADEAKEILHSYLCSIGEPDVGYVYSQYLTTLDLSDEGSTEQEQAELNSTSKTHIENTSEEANSEVNEDGIEKPKTADDLITVIDKSATHE